jgi:hypothetical protein
VALSVPTSARSGLSLAAETQQEVLEPGQVLLAIGSLLSSNSPSTKPRRDDEEAFKTELTDSLAKGLFLFGVVVFVKVVDGIPGLCDRVLLLARRLLFPPRLLPVSTSTRCLQVFAATVARSCLSISILATKLYSAVPVLVLRNRLFLFGVVVFVKVVDGIPGLCDRVLLLAGPATPTRQYKHALSSSVCRDGCAQLLVYLDPGH